VKSSIVLLVVASACGGSVAKGVRPDDPTYARAVGEKCVTGDGSPQPLVVDWRADARADLEVAMKRGVAVVAYDCKSLRVLPDCTVDGSYGFAGVSYKEQKLHLQNTDEIKANLPAGVIAASFDAQTKRDAALDVQLAIAGKQLATVSDATMGKLRGRCTGATHFVRAVTVGAFSLDTSTSATVDASAKLVASASTNGTSAKTWHQQDGDRAACASAVPGAVAPPAGCSSPLRLDLAAFEPEPTTVDVAPNVAASVAPGGACPRGLVWAGGACAVPNQTTAHKCKSGDVEDCRAQCERGDALSCTDLGFEYLLGRRVPLDYRRALALFRQACDGSEPYGCNDVGALLISGMAGQRDEVRAVQLFSSVCDQEPKLCSNLAVSYRDGLGLVQHPARATELFSRACLGGDASSCHDVAIAYDKGIGVPKDVPRAAELDLQSCRGGFAFGCAVAGTRYLYGQGVPISETTAVQFFKRACAAKDQYGCGLVGLMMWDGQGGLAADPANARRTMEQACNSGSSHICAILAITLRGKGDTRDARYYEQRACEGGVGDHCKPGQ
jgi:TPR repeat protein